MTTLTEQIYQSAKNHALLVEYAGWSMDNPEDPKRVAFQSDESAVHGFKNHERLLVHFLFPNVTDDCREFLFKLAWARKGMELSRNHPAGNQASKTMFEQLSTDAEVLLDDMLPFQAEIMREVYLKDPE